MPNLRPTLGANLHWFHSRVKESNHSTILKLLDRGSYGSLPNKKMKSLNNCYLKKTSNPFTIYSMPTLTPDLSFCLPSDSLSWFHSLAFFSNKYWLAIFSTRPLYFNYLIIIIPLSMFKSISHYYRRHTWKNIPNNFLTPTLQDENMTPHGITRQKMNHYKLYSTYNIYGKVAAKAKL